MDHENKKITLADEHIKHLHSSSIAVNDNYLVAAYYDEDFDESEIQIFDSSTLKSIGIINNDYTKNIHSVYIHDNKLYFWNINEAKIHVTDIFFKSKVLTIGRNILECQPRCISFNKNEMFVLDKYGISVFDSKTGDHLRYILPDVDINHISSMQVDDDYLYFLVWLPKRKNIYIRDKNIGQHVKIITCDSDMISCTEDKMIIIGNYIIATDIINKKIFVIDKQTGNKIYETIDDLQILEPLVANNKKLYLSCYHDLHTYNLYL